MARTPPSSAPIATLAADAIRNALDGGAQYGAVDRAVYAHSPHDDSAHDELVTAVDTLLRTGHVTVTPVGTPDPAALLTEIESLRAELAQARAEGRAQVIAELRTRATGPMLHRVLDEVAEMFAGHPEPMHQPYCVAATQGCCSCEEPPTPACTCRAEAVHQAGCDTSQHA